MSCMQPDVLEMQVLDPPVTDPLSSLLWGEEYTEDNIRPHMYFDHINVPREPDATYSMAYVFGPVRGKLLQVQVDRDRTGADAE